MKLSRRLLLVIITGCLLATQGRLSALIGAELGKQLSLSSIVAGAKKEGKVSWGTYLDEKEVGEINQGFQKEFPFIQIEYTRLRPPHERLMLEMQAGNFPYEEFQRLWIPASGGMTERT